jgi:uncharacterized repeat protein (TIGR02543 family)
MMQEQIYTLSFRPGKGEVSRRSLEVKVGEPLPALPIPQRKDYTFDGWYTEEGGKGQKYVPGDIPTKDLVLHAHWIKRKAAKKKSLYRTQKNAAITLAVSFALLIAVLIGGKLMGLFGMIFFIPLTAVVFQLIREHTNRVLEEKQLRDADTWAKDDTTPQ